MINQYTLKNGMKVVFEQMEHVHSVSFGVWVFAGSKDEQEFNNGIAHMVEHMVFKGTKTRSAKDIADETAAIGGNINAYTSKEFTSYYARILKEHLKEAIGLFGDMIINSNMSQEELEKEKGIVIEEIDMYNDSPEDLSHEVLQKKVWDKHPLGYLISGERNTVLSFTSEDLHKFVKDYYVGENMVISLAGNFNEKETLKWLEDVFGKIARKGKEKFNSSPIFQPCLYVENKDVEQIHLNIVYDSITSVMEERYGFAVLNSILGGSVNSRLFLRIREELGITYSIYTYGSSFQEAGLFHIYAAMNPNQFSVVMEEIGKELKKFLDEGPKKDELFYAKEQIKTDLIIQEESTKYRMNSNAKSILQFGTIVTLEEVIEKVNKVSREDCIRYMEEYFKSENTGIGIVGNVDKLKKSELSQKLLSAYL